MKRFLDRAVAVVVILFVAPVLCATVALGALLFLPLPATLPEAKPGLESRISHVLDAEGNEIAVFREFEISIPVAQTDIPQVLKDAVVAAEDKNFYSHGGIDLRATLRALYNDLRNRAVVQGGSTITQQYVKNAFTSGERTIGRKIREAILATQLDRQLDKDTILFRYLSTIYLGEGAYGVGAAAETYFRKPASQLTLSESALLAGLIPAPSRYSPRVDPATAEIRRRYVLDQMLGLGRIDPAAHAAAVAEPVWLAANGEPPGPATVVFPPQQQQSTNPWFTDYVRAWLTAHLPGCTVDKCDLLYRGGLQIETTMDPRAQMAAEEEVARQLGDNDPTLQMALVAVEPPTGYVRAMVGGREFDYAQSVYNTALAGRQSGSAFKPVVLAAAFEQGIQPTATYSGSPCPTPSGDVIENYGGASYGTMSLRNATWDSVNGVYCRLILDVGVDQTMTMAQRLGIASTPPFDPSVHGAAVTLGVTNATPLEMATAFGVFANHGAKVPPTPILRVLGPDGAVIIDNTDPGARSEQVIQPAVADNVTDVLRGVLTDGTAGGKGLDRPAAGKTGTAEDNGNAWFVGFTPTLSTAVWMGYRDCNCPLRGINGVREVTGGTLPASSWQRFMRAALANVPVTEFTEPAPIQTYADIGRRAARGGFDPGPRRNFGSTGAGGPYVEEAPVPVADPPPTTTTTLPPSTTSTTSSTTTTTRPPIFGN